VEFTAFCRQLHSQHLNYRGPDAEEVQKELRDSRSLLSQELLREFGRVVVLDLENGVIAGGTFDIERFLQAAWKQMATALGHYHDDAAFHPEQIAQLLKSEDPLLFCFLNVHKLSAEDLHRLRGLGFSQENHRILYVGTNSALQNMGYPLIDPQQDHGTRTGGWSLMENLDAISTDSAKMTFESSRAAYLPPAPVPTLTLAEDEEMLEDSSAVPSEAGIIPPAGGHTGARGPGFLKVVKGSCPGFVIELVGERNVIGRHASCQIVLDNAAVSRNHAQILESHGTYYLEDLRSRNGTLLNGTRIQGRTEIKNSDEIRVCEVVLRFYLGLPLDSSDDSLAERIKPLGASQIPTIFEADLVPESQGSSQGNATAEGLESDSSSIITSLDAKNRNPRIIVRPEVKLRAVMEISQNLARTLNAEEVFPKILESLFKLFPQADRGFIVLKDPVGGTLQVKSQRVRRDDLIDSTRVSATILHEAMNKRIALLSADATSDQRFQSSDSVASMTIRSVMCAPLMGQTGDPLGAIQIDTVNNAQPFAADDLEVLASMATQAALALENAQLHTAALKQRDYERDLEFATQVQLGFLPNERPHVVGYDLFDFYEPARRVGGDFVDYVALPDGRLAMSVGDVAGKGLPSALLMARICGDARAYLLTKPSPAEALFSLHQSVVTSGSGDRFVTMLLAVLDPQSHSISLVNAGHLPPLLRRADGTVERVGADECGLPLGVETDVPFTEKTLGISPGELLVLYSDGLTEAMNATNEIYGLQRLVQVVSTQGTTAQSAVEAVVADVDSFCGPTPPRDDIFIVALQRVVEGPAASG
jgi:serine phosphatase RsbU (regulator of sigma subunit)